MWKYFSKTGELNYTSVLQDIVQSYNSKHSSIGTSPNRVTKETRAEFGIIHTKMKLINIRADISIR